MIRRAVAIAPREASFLINLALVLREAGQIEAAAASLRAPMRRPWRRWTKGARLRFPGSRRSLQFRVWNG